MKKSKVTPIFAAEGLETGREPAEVPPQEPKPDSQRRFYYVKVVDVQKIDCKLMDIIDRNRRSIQIGSEKRSYDKESELKIQFKLANGKSNTKIGVNLEEACISAQSRQRVKKESHMLSYSNNEHLEVQLVNPDDRTYSGFMKVLLTPFLEEPHTRHRVEVGMKVLNEEGQFERGEDGRIEDIAVIVIDIFFLLEFEGQMQIIPIEAHLKNNPSVIGQLETKVFITLNGETKKTMKIESGGIHPRWNQYAKKKREYYEELSKEMEKKDYLDNLTEKQKEELANIFTFDLTSTAHPLKISVVSYPLLGCDPEIIGEAEIQLVSENFFRTPGSLYFHTGSEAIKLYWWKYKENTTQLEYVEVGHIVIGSIFVKDIEKLSRQIDDEDDAQEQEQEQEGIKSNKNIPMHFRNIFQSEKRIS